MNEESITIRKMTIDDLKLAISWGNKESWNLSEHDAEAFLAQDPQGFFIGELNGDPVAAVSAPIYQNYAHIDFFLVKEEYRKKGYGKKIFQHAIDYVKNADSIGVISVEGVEGFYEKWGFRIHDHILRMAKIAERTMSSGLAELRYVPIDQLTEYDRSVFGNYRKSLLQTLLNQKRCYGLCMVKGDKLVGYGIMRECEKGFKVGPLIADHKDIAKKVLDGLQNFIVGQEVIVDIPEKNINTGVIEKHKWRQVDKYYKMYRNGLPGTEFSKVYSSIIEMS